MVASDEHADRLRARRVREWLAPFRLLHQELLRVDPEYRAQNAARYREHYRRHRDNEVARVAAYKRAHADRNLEWTAVRKEREAVLADGTVTPEAVAQLKQEAVHCAYCGCVLADKQTDHMIPLVLGGEHSLRNIVVVCPTCNGRKAQLSYEEWLERVDPRHRDRVRAVYRERYGNALAA
jgi:5-methylcytosine-specific restriction endonuclease McrA